MSTAPSLYPSFNARNLTAQQVASTFVAPDQFSILSSECHSLVLGPRGSGKTTLLKMLQPQALDSWDAPEADKWRDAVRFIGVYVPADISWGMQLATIERGRLDEDAVALFGIAAFTTHTLKAFIHTMEYVNTRGHSRARCISRDSESAIARSLSEAWGLSGQPRSFLALRLALRARLMSIKTLASQEAARGSTGRGERLAGLEMLHIEFVEACSLALDQFSACSECEEAKWALMFDELELAPPAVMRTLLSSVRSTDQRFLFKLSLVPYGSDTFNADATIKAARVDEDYKLVRLWFAHKEDGYPFCRDLWKAVLREKRLPDVDPEKVFGRSMFDLGRDEWSEEGTSYRADSRVGRAIASLALKDVSFARYLADRGIDVDNLERIEGRERASTLRKVGALVILRDALLSSSDKQRKRSRKNLGLYTGADALFAMVEGNPRWFKGLVGQLLAGYEAGGEVTPEFQQTCIDAASERFRSLLRTVPREGAPLGVLELLDRLGSFLHKRQVLEEFDADPIGTFRIETNIRPDVVRLLGQAMNQGAIVRMDDEHSTLTADLLVGQRLRLSYLLAPHYRVLLRAGRAVHVGAALDRTGGGELF